MAEASLLKSVSIKRGKDAPDSRMWRGSAAAAGDKCYFLPYNSTNIRVYDAAKDDWLALRPSLYTHAGLAVINGLLTTIGGQTPETSFFEPTNVLQSQSNRRWIEKFPPMTILDVDNKKAEMAVVQTGNSVIVIGGDHYGKRVDMLDTTTSVWSALHKLTGYSERGNSAAICGDELYVLNRDGNVFQCFLDELKDDSKPEGSVWTEVAKVPYSEPTLGSLCGQVVAIGGWNSKRSIQAFDPNKDCWYEIGKMAVNRQVPLVAQLSEDKLVVVGSSEGNVTITEIITGVV